MDEAGLTPLVQLGKACALCLQGETGQQGSNCAACRRLLYRALCEGNDGAWDEALRHLWPLILRSLYAAQPELTPTGAAGLGYQALLAFRRAIARRRYTSTTFPAFPALLALLQRCVGEAGVGNDVYR
jgi:hypothetical protein